MKELKKMLSCSFNILNALQSMFDIEHYREEINEAHIDDYASEICEHTRAMEDLLSGAMHKLEHEKLDKIEVSCPYCGNREEIPKDEQMIHLQSFEILFWVTGDLNETEQSYMRCTVCDKAFNHVW